jgi:hypothetical protein
VPNQFELPAGKRFERKYMFQQTFKNIDDVLWKEAGCTTELDYTEQTSWMLFLEYLDDLEQENGWRILHAAPAHPRQNPCGEP